MNTIGEIVAKLDSVYPPDWAADWDRVGLVCGRPETRVDRVLFAVDCVAATVAQAKEVGARLLVTHHPLLLRGVSSIAPTDYKGEILHTLIESKIGLYVAHTNADVASPGVSDALAERIGLTGLRPLSPIDDGPRGIGRVGVLPEPMTLAEFAQHAAGRLPGTAAGLRVAGDPERRIEVVAVSGGAGDGYLTEARAAGADVYLTADLRHHVAGEYIEDDSPALIDAAHWATEQPWLDLVAAQVRDAFDVDTVVSNRSTDPWGMHVASTDLSTTTQLGARVQADPADQRRLLTLQQIDTALNQLTHRRTHLPQETSVAELTKMVNAATDTQAQTEAAAYDLDRDIARVEREIEQVRNRADKDRARQQSGSASPKELTSLEHELQTLARRQSELEDQQLDLMEQKETAVATAQEQGELLNRRQEELSAVTAERDAEIADIEAEMARRRDEREETVAELPEDLVALYEKIRKRNQSVAAAMLRQRRCEGCRIEQPGGELAQLRTAAPNHVARCDNCGAILVRTSESGL